MYQRNNKTKDIVVIVRIYFPRILINSGIYIWNSMSIVNVKTPFEMKSASVVSCSKIKAPITTETDEK